MKLQKIFALILFSYTYFSVALAQFTDAQKNTVVSYLNYPKTEYDIKINFYASAYTDYPKDSLENLSEEMLLKKITNTPKDASIYAKLTIERYKKQIFDNKIDEYYDKTVQNYQQQINENPTNIKIVSEFLDFAVNIKNGELIKKIIDYGLQNEPNNVEILLGATNFYLNYEQNLDKADEYISKALKLDRYNASMIVLKLGVDQLKTIQSMQKNQKATLDISIAENIFKEKPNEIKYEHLYHYARCSQIYISIMFDISMDSTFKSTDNPFDKVVLNENETKAIKEAELFFLKNIKKSSKYKAIMLENLGFLSSMQKKYKQSIKFYEQYFNESKNMSGLESCILLYYVQKNYKKAVEYTEKRLNQFDDLKTNCLLVRLYHETKDKQKSQKIIDKIKNMKEDAKKSKAETLAIFYLMQKNIKNANIYLKDFENSNEIQILLLQLTKNVLENNKIEAKKNLDMILEQDKKNENAFKIKKVLQF